MKLYELLIFIIGCAAISAGCYQLGKFIASVETKPEVIRIEEQRDLELDERK
jgi:hypothetical protein